MASSLDPTGTPAGGGAGGLQPKKEEAAAKGLTEVEMSKLMAADDAAASSDLRVI